MTNRFEFDALFEKFDYASIREQILTRRMTTSPFTTVLWRIFLHCLPRAFDQWEKTIDLSREHYEDLVDKFYVDEKKVREINHVDDKNHPLSQEDRVIRSNTDILLSDLLPLLSSRVSGVNIMNIKD